MTSRRRQAAHFSPFNLCRPGPSLSSNTQSGVHSDRWGRHTCTHGHTHKRGPERCSSLLVHPSPLQQVNAPNRSSIPAAACKRGETAGPHRRAPSTGPLFICGGRNTRLSDEAPAPGCGWTQHQEAGWRRRRRHWSPHLNKLRPAHIKWHGRPV